MTARRVGLLLGAGLLIIAFAIWLSSRRHLDRATLAGDRLLPGLESVVNTVNEVRLSRGDGTHTGLRKGASDWSVAERDYPADSGKVRKLLLDLAALEVVEEKTRTPANYPQLGVEEVGSPKASGTRVDVVTPSQRFALIVGKSGGTKSSYVRVAGAAPSFLATPALALDADPRRWLDHTLLDVPQERIREMTVRPADGPAYSASRTSKDQADFAVTGIPKGRQLSSPAAADSLAGSLGGLTLDDVRRAAEPSAAPPQVTFRTFDGLELDIAGRKDGARTFIAITPRSMDKQSQAEAQTIAARVKGWEFEVPSYKYDSLFRPLEDLLQKLPEKPPKAKSGVSSSGRSAKDPDQQPPGAVPPKGAARPKSAAPLADPAANP